MVSKCIEDASDLDLPALRALGVAGLKKASIPKISKVCQFLSILLRGAPPRKLKTVSSIIGYANSMKKELLRTARHPAELRESWLRRVWNCQQVGGRKTC